MKQTLTLLGCLAFTTLLFSQKSDTTSIHGESLPVAASSAGPLTPPGSSWSGVSGPDFAGRCNNLPTLTCGGFVSGSTVGSNSFNAADYKLPFGGDYDGPDKAYRIVVSAQTSAHFILDILSANNDLDLILLKQCGDQSSQVTLAGYSLEKNTATGYYREVLDLNLLPGTYTLVVDGKYSDQFGNFKVTMNCTCTCIEPYYDLPYGTKLLCDNFQDYQTNKALTPQSSRWGLFNNDPYQHNSRDATVRGEAGGNQYAQVNYYIDPSGAGNDRIANVLYQMDNRTSGRYRVSWRTWIEPNKGGLYYALHRNADSVGNDAQMKIAYAVFFNPGGGGNLLTFPDPANGNGSASPFTYAVNDWNDVVNIIDIDADVAELWINGNFVHRWKFSLTKGDGTMFKRLESFLFTGGKTAAGIIQDYRVDDICVWQTTAPCTPTGSGSKVCIENKVDQIPIGTARCKLYTSDEWFECYTVCDYGGTYIYRGLEYSGKMLQSDFAPAFVKNDPCVVAAYNNNVPQNLYADIYVFHKADQLDMDVLMSNQSPNCRLFVFACNYKQGNSCVYGQKCLQDVGSHYAPYTCDSLYYIVVTGDLFNTYTIKVVPDGPCKPSSVETLNIACTNPLSASKLTVNNAVPPADPLSKLKTSTSYFNCYSGSRPYTGGERVYKLSLRNSAFVEFNLIAKERMGIFLFTALCGVECETFAENSILSDTATIFRKLDANDYFLVVDKALDGGDPNFQLQVECIGTDGKILIYYDCGGNFTSIEHLKSSLGSALSDAYCGCKNDPSLFAPDSIHSVKINENALAFSDKDVVNFYVKDPQTKDLTSTSILSQPWPAIKTAGSFIMPIDLHTDTIKCSYALGDTFFIVITNTDDGNQNYRFVRPIFQQPVPTGEPNATDTFKLKGVSQINSLEPYETFSRVLFRPLTSGKDLLATENSLDFVFGANLPWKATLQPPVPWVTKVDPNMSNGEGGQNTRLINIETLPNPHPRPRSTNLKIASLARPDVIYTIIPIVQRENCDFTPTVSITATAPAVCMGDTVRLTAKVTNQTGDDISDAFAFKWSNGQFTQLGRSIKDTLETAGTTQYTVTAVGHYCADKTATTNASVTVRELPPAPTPVAGSTDRTACLGNSAALTVTNNAPALASIQWFDSPSGTEVKFTGNAYAPPPPGQPGAYTFYAQAKYSSGTPQCASARIPATLTVRALPDFTIEDKKCAPELETTYSFKVNTAAGNTVTVVTGTGNVTPSGNGQFSISGIPKNTNLTFRVRDNSPQGCFRDSTVTGLPCNCQAPPKPIPQAVAPVCAGGEATLQVSVPPGAHYTVEWFEQAAGGIAVKKNADTYKTSVLKTYWAETFDTLSKCRSTERTEMKITVNELPPLDIIGTECEADFDHYTLIVKRVVGINLSLSPAAGNPPVLTADRISISRIPEGTDLLLTATNALTGCFTTKNVESPECGCPLIDPPTGAPTAQTYCAGQPILPIEVMVKANETADWLSADGDTLLLNSTVFTPASSTASYFVRARNILSNCLSEPRSVAVVVHPLPSVTLSPPVCNPNLLDYSVEFSSADGQPPALPNLFANGAGGFLVDNIANGQNLSFTLTNPLTTCSRSVQVAAPTCTCASLAPLSAPVFVKNEAYCQGDTALPALRVKVAAGETADWYNAAGGLEKEGDTLFVPSGKGSYFAVRRNLTNDCVSTERTAVTLSENPLPTINVTRKDCAPDLLSYEISLTANADLLTANWGDPTGAMPSFKVTNIPRDSAVTVTATIAATGCASSQKVSPKQCDCAAFPVNQPSAVGPNPLVLCADAALPLLTVNVAASETATWYDSLGNVLASDTLRYQPKSGGVFLVESRNRQTGCLSDTRLAYRLTVNPIPALEVVSATCNQALEQYTLLVKTNGKLSQPSPFVAINNNDGTYTIPDIDLGVMLQLLSTFTATGCKAQQTYQKTECPCPTLSSPQSLGDAEVCKDATALPLLAVKVNDPNLETVDWYNAAGIIVRPNSLTYQPTAATTATYFAQTRYKFSGECVNGNRTPVALTVFEPVQLLTGGSQKVCEGEAIVLNGSISGGISTGFWSAPVGSFSPSASTLNATYQPPAGVSSVTLTLTSGDPAGPCSALSGQVTMEVKPRPTFEEKLKVCAPNLLTYNVEFLVPPTAQPSINLPIMPQFLGGGLYRVSGIPRDSNLRVTVLDPDSKCSAVFDVITDNCPCSVIGLPTEPNNPVICPEQSIPYLTVLVPQGQTVNWYSETGTLLKADTIAYQPAVEGTYFAEAQEKVSGCASQGRTPVTLTIKPSPVADAGDSTAICPGKTATLSAVGAFDAYLWSNGATTPSTMVSPTTTQFYWLTVKQDGCSNTDSVKVTVRDAVLTSIQEVSPIKCFGDKNGGIRAFPAGGAAPYSLLWSTGAATAVVSNLGIGTYTVTVSDKWLCTASAEYGLTQPPLLVVSTSTIGNATAGDTSGYISIQMAGGTQPYSYQWTDSTLVLIPGATLDFLDDLTAGQYWVIVTDKNGCTLNKSFVVKNTGGTVGTPGLPDERHPVVRLYPNPTDGRLFLHFEVLDKGLPVAVQMFDALGRPLHIGSPARFDESTFEYDLSLQPSGLYWLQVRLGDAITVQKVLIQK